MPRPLRRLVGKQPPPPGWEFPLPPADAEGECRGRGAEGEGDEDRFDVIYDPVSERYKIEIHFAGDTSLPPPPLPECPELVGESRGHAEAVDLCEGSGDEEAAASPLPPRQPSCGQSQSPTANEAIEEGCLGLAAAAEEEEAAASQHTPSQASLGRGPSPGTTAAAEEGWQGLAAAAAEAVDTPPPVRQPCLGSAVTPEPGRASGEGNPGPAVGAAQAVDTPPPLRQPSLGSDLTPEPGPASEDLFGSVLAGIVQLSAAASQPRASPAEVRELLEATIGAVERLADWRWPATAGLGLGQRKELSAKTGRRRERVLEPEESSEHGCRLPGLKGRRLQ